MTESVRGDSSFSPRSSTTYLPTYETELAAKLDHFELQRHCAMPQSVLLGAFSSTDSGALLVLGNADLSDRIPLPQSCPRMTTALTAIAKWMRGARLLDGDRHGVPPLEEAESPVRSQRERPWWIFAT